MWFYVFKELYLRDRSAFFWILVFPTIMYLVFSAIFSGVGKEIKLEMGIVGRSRYFEEALKHMNIDVILRRYDDVENLKRAVEDADVDLGIVLENFDRDLALTIMTGGMRKAKVEVFYRSEDEISSIGAEIMRGVFENADIEMLKILGKVNGVKIVYEGQKERATDPYLPVGMTLAILGSGVLGVSFGNSHLERKGLSKLFRTTPVGSVEILAFSSHITALFLSVFLVFSVGLALGRVESVDWTFFMLWIALGSTTFVSIGTMVSSLGEIVTNLLYFSLMFTGGIFFPVSGVMKIVAWFNPVYHLNGGISRALGLEADFAYKVPAIWMVLSVVIIFLRRREVG